MKILNLFEIGEATTRPRKNISAAFDRMNAEQSKIFRTHAWSGHHEENSGYRNFTFITTSKDIHLNLGRFDLNELIDLGHVINDAFEADDIHLLVRGKATAIESLLVTRSIKGDKVILTLASAR